jgi:hypothetical protein
MSITFTAEELSRIEATVEALLSPAACADVDSWRDRVLDRLATLLHADRAGRTRTRPRSGRAQLARHRARRGHPEVRHARRHPAGESRPGEGGGWCEVRNRMPASCVPQVQSALEALPHPE